MEKELKEIFDKYEKSYQSFSEILKDKGGMHLRNQRLIWFNIRIRLAIDIEVSFKGEVSRTKAPNVGETYSLLVKLMESWNSFEILSKYAKEKDKDCFNEKYTFSSAPRFNLFLESVLKKAGCIPVLHYELEILKKKYNDDKKFGEQFKKLLERFESEVESETLKKCCLDLIKYFEGKKEKQAQSILGLAYATRNMYYHDGEVAGKEMDYQGRIFLLKSLIYCFQKHILLLASYIITKEINIKQCSYANLQ